MRIVLTSVLVDDQDKALRFYTNVLGFIKKTEVPLGAHRWLTVVSPEEPNGTELLLEPSDNPAAQTFKQAIFEQGIPATAFAVADIQQEYVRLKELGVEFTMEPTKFQPGRAVYYVSAEGKIIRVVEPNEFAMPNGIVLSPDGKTLYINNCYDDASWFPVKSEKDNHIWAYDVAADGTISNGRKFATLFLPGNVLDRKARSSSADGMAIDKQVNLYVATYYGVQICNNKGGFVGMINLPSLSMASPLLPG